jgi:thymidylate synthase (FAD)
MGQKLTLAEHEYQKAAERLYRERLEVGVAREQARKDLPLCTYTEAYWKIDLHNLLHFLALRMDSHAQLEIREYATTLGEQIVAKLFPTVWDAFIDYRRDAMALSRLDVGVMQRLTKLAATQGAAFPVSEELFMQAQDEQWRVLARSRERDECREKLVKLGLVQEAAE